MRQVSAGVLTALALTIGAGAAIRAGAQSPSSDPRVRMLEGAGTPVHSWQAVACDGMSIGVKGMMVAAKTMALTAIDLMTNPEHLAKARAEFDRRRAGTTYTLKIGDRKPPLDYRKD